MSALGRSALDALDAEDLAALAAAVAPFLPMPVAPVENRRLATRDAAEFLGISTNALHKVTASEIPYQQNCDGGKRWYWIADLQQWNRRGRC